MVQEAGSMIWLARLRGGVRCICRAEKSLPHPRPISRWVPYRYLVRTDIIKWKFQSVLGGPNSREYPETSIAEGMIPVNKTVQTFRAFQDDKLSQFLGEVNGGNSRAEREGGQFLILRPSEDGQPVALSGRPNGSTKNKIPQPTAEVNVLFTIFNWNERERSPTW